MMQVKFLKSIVEDLTNKNATPIIDLLLGKKHINEFSIAKKLNLTINQTRNILYRLSDFGLVSFIRKKDKRKGWYIYFWTLDIAQSLNLLRQNLNKQLLNLEEQLKSRIEKRFYICNTCSIEVTEESALLNDFSCQECEEIYELLDSKNIINELEKSTNKIKKDLDLINVEIEKENEKIEKKKSKEIKKLEKEKKEKRDAKRLANKKEREKNKPKKIKKLKLKKNINKKKLKQKIKNKFKKQKIKTKPKNKKSNKKLKN